MEITLDWDGDVAVAKWNDGENRLNPDSMDRLHSILDTVADHEGPTAFVLTGTGKFFSNGLDLDRFADNSEEFELTFRSLHRFLGRVLDLPCYTVCAINGHAFAGGALSSSVFDWRIMREDRGFWCMNEIDIKIPVTKAMYGALASHIPAPALSEALLTGRRFSGPEALAAGVVDQIEPEDSVLPSAIARAAAMADKDRATMQIHKRHLFGQASELCIAES